jgi:hypothetical protein
MFYTMNISYRSLKNEKNDSISEFPTECPLAGDIFSAKMMSSELAMEIAHKAVVECRNNGYQVIHNRLIT